MSVDRLLGFAAISLVLVLIPGPSVLFVLGRALAHGRRTALGSVLGNAIGAYVLATLVSLGLGEVVARSVTIFLALKLAGAAYLVFLGVKAWRHRGALSMSAMGTDEQPANRSDLRTLWEGFVVGVTNPKTMIFFAAVLPQFVDRGAGRV
ncbi:MAG: LysE family translocator, partial [Actinomycetia bacterium]|nr:LysE family translocator [Actinomycetes bacterium]